MSDARDDATAPDEPDQPYEAFEDDEASAREAAVEEAGLTAFGGPSFGALFEPVEQDGGFDAEHNP
ncbi:hypothetical protein [Leifsonia sp. 71-9]|uniref:hypothetical protein n=1 Tax=Leifsonia sp. 71-9 TaxID=1895934 RepID=UPI000929A6D5|nr:hypothetical protein [Leifsonia sp. 71-9]OJX77566.1 MAG: hypothetical protein BGO91_10615 [Leifsonia sp. 71-9]